MSDDRCGYRHDDAPSSSSGNSDQGESSSSSQPADPQISIEPQSIERGVQEQINPQSIESGHVIRDREIRM